MQARGKRVLSGMRPTGALHLGHLCGVLWNWRELQKENECFFFVADWHALTTDYASPPGKDAAREMALAWLAAGIDPARAAMFAQSDVPAHAELCVLLSMICPLPWLTQQPTYKEQKANLNRDIDTYGFLGYPLLQAADILAYRADGVPVGEDQVPHVEFARAVARRFNHLYGRTASFNVAAKKARKELGNKREQFETYVRQHERAGTSHTEKMINDIIEKAAEENRSVLRGFAHQGAEEILPPPQEMLTQAPKLPGTDGRKMSKSYDNAVAIFDSPEEVGGKLARMQTDPARKRRTDPGDPDKCPVWDLHKIFSDDKTRAPLAEGCRSASIGCVDCKRALAENVNAELAPIHDARKEYDKPGVVEGILNDGAKRARAEVEETLTKVRDRMSLK